MSTMSHQCSCSKLLQHSGYRTLAHAPTMQATNNKQQATINKQQAKSHLAHAVVVIGWSAPAPVTQANF